LKEKYHGQKKSKDFVSCSVMWDLGRKILRDFISLSDLNTIEAPFLKRCVFVMNLGQF
jgi:hypothetical protein